MQSILELEKLPMLDFLRQGDIAHQDGAFVRECKLILITHFGAYVLNLPAKPESGKSPLS